MSERQGTWKLLVDGVPVAGGSGPYDDCVREAAHYAMMYRDEGEVVKPSVRRCPVQRQSRSGAAEVMRNKFPETCYRCGCHVDVGQGHSEWHMGTWKTQHATCAILWEKAIRRDQDSIDVEPHGDG